MNGAPGPALSVTGWSVHLPAGPAGTLLAGAPPRRLGPWAHETHAAAAEAASVVGRKGLLFKEPATRLALCAVHRALRLPAGRRAPRTLDPRTAVVVCSTLGNVDCVARVIRTVNHDGAGEVSVLDAPNVSSNVMATTVALWFGFGGPNFMITSSDRAGLHALQIARLLLRAGRADRVVLVGAEPADDVAARLHAGDGRRPPLTPGAGCLVIERNPTRDAVLLTTSPPDSAPEHADLTLGAGQAHGAGPTCGADQAHRADSTPGALPPVAGTGSDHHAATTLIHAALAAHLVGDDGARAVAVAAPGPSVLMVSAGEGRPR